MDGLTSFLEYFQITEMAFRNEVLEKFADIKHNFKARDERSNRIRINFAEHPQQFFDISLCLDLAASPVMLTPMAVKSSKINLIR